MRKGRNKLVTSLLTGVLATSGLSGKVGGEEPTATIEFLRPVMRQNESSSYVFKGTTRGAPATGLVAGYIFNGESPLPSFMQIRGHTIYSACGDNCGIYEVPSIFAGEQVNNLNLVSNNVAEIAMVVSMGNFGLPEPSGNIARFDFTVPGNVIPGVYQNRIAGAALSVYDGNFGYFQYPIPPSNYTHGTLTILPSLDVNNDGVVDALDDNAFVEVLLGRNTNPTAMQRADQNMDGVADGRDIGDYISGRING